MLVKICFAGNLFISERKSSVEAAALSPQLTIDTSGFINAMYSARVTQGKEFKTPEFMSKVSPETFKARLFESPQYDHNLVSMDFKQTLVNENISAAFA